MPAKNMVYRLVHSLSQAELRYVRMQMGSGTGRKNQNGQILLDTFLEIVPFQEELLNERLRQLPGGKNISLLQNRLMETVLRSLRQQYDRGNPTATIRAALSDIELLLERELFGPARKRIKKAMALAEEWEEYALLLELLKWKQKLVFKAPKGKGFAQSWEEIREKEEAIFEKLHRKQELERLNFEVRSGSRLLLQARSAQEVREFQEILQLPLLSNRPTQQEFLANYFYDNMLGLLHFACKEYDQALHHYRLQFQNWQTHNKWIEARADDFLSSYNNYLNICLMHPNGKEEFKKAIGKVDDYGALLPQTQYKVNRIRYAQQFSYVLNFEPFEVGEKVVREVERWVSAQGKHLLRDHEIAFYHNFAMFSFVNGQFREAHKWLRQIRQLPHGRERPDVRDCARFMHLITHFELGNLDLQEYLLRSAYRYFRKSDGLHTLETGIITLMKKAVNKGKLLQEDIQQFKEVLETLREDLQGKRLIGMDEVFLWTESKLQGRNIREVWDAYRGL